MDGERMMAWTGGCEENFGMPLSVVQCWRATSASFMQRANDYVEAGVSFVAEKRLLDERC